MADAEVRTSIVRYENVHDSESDTTEHTGSVHILDDMVYVSISEGLALGFDRFILDELLKREKLPATETD